MTAPFLGRFQRRLSLAFCLILLASTAAVDLLLTQAFRARLVAELSRNLTVEAGLAADLIQRRPPAPGETEALARELGARCGCRVTVIRRDGVVLGDSDVSERRLPSLENHAERPEVRAALGGEPGVSIRHSATLGVDLLYAAVPLPGYGVLRAALPLTEVERQAAQVRRTIAAISLLTLLAALLLTFWLSSSLARPLEDIARLARRLSDGDYGARVRVAPDDEHRRLAEALNALGAKVQETVEALGRDRAQLAAILDSIVEAVAAVDSQGRLLAANPALRALLGADAQPGRRFVEVLRHPKLQDLVASVLKEGRPRVEEVDLLTPAERHFEAHAVPLLEHGRAGGALLVLHDITRLRQLEKVRRDFVANVSHELRTPLASIRGFAETLRDGAIDDKEHRMDFVESIEKDAERLSALVEDLLDLSAIESGQRRPVLAPVSVLEVAREAAASLRPLSERLGVAVVVKDAPGLPAVRADRGQLKQVLTNLLDNGVKFNKEGGKVTVAVRADARSLVVEVGDTGPGIPAEDLPRLFERFYRVDKARGREVGGTGLGLSIVKHIVESHGGAVSVDSRLDQGSVFRFTLPLS
jgi:two-component system phosphate regulon sensor histidine kinase PhoR